MNNITIYLEDGELKLQQVLWEGEESNVSTISLTPEQIPLVIQWLSECAAELDDAKQQ